jgi:hypothetical protein
MYSLHAIAGYYERLYDGTMSMYRICQSGNLLTTISEGQLIRYGQPEPWKIIANNIGRTKPSRAGDTKRKKNDGRPPDTTKELLKPERSKKKSETQQLIKFKTQPKPKPSNITLGPVSYPWKDNSCWLDTSLELIYVTLMRDFDGFADIC